MEGYTGNNDFVRAQDVNEVLTLIRETIDEMEDKGPAAASLTFLENTRLAKQHLSDLQF